MKLVPALTWTLESGVSPALDPRLMPLLEAIGATGSLAAAVDARDMSYRAGWGLLREYGRKFGAPLVVFERGRGARLDDAGARLLEANHAAQRRLVRALASLHIDVGPPQVPSRIADTPLVIAASHDLALASLRDLAPGERAPAFDLSFMGSLNALMQFAERRADIAGFHVPAGAKPSDLAPFRRWLDPRRDRLVDVVLREQGLILPRGNPSRVRAFRDIAAKKLRFVNRQIGSGTRLLIERMVADAHLDPRTVRGYSHEEFTHPAVAATVASGAADVGFGLRAAAAERDLSFVPLVHERYFLAVRAADVHTTRLSALLALLRGVHFAKVVSTLAGYAAPHPGRVVRVSALAREQPAGAY